MIERMQHIRSKGILFVKRDPGFNLTEDEMSHVIRTLERDQRIRSKPKLNYLEGESQIVNNKTQSNYKQLVNVKIGLATALETYDLNTREKLKAKRSKVR